MDPMQVHEAVRDEDLTNPQLCLIRDAALNALAAVPEKDQLIFIVIASDAEARYQASRASRRDPADRILLSLQAYSEGPMSPEHLLGCVQDAKLTPTAWRLVQSAALRAIQVGLTRQDAPHQRELVHEILVSAVKAERDPARCIHAPGGFAEG